MLQPTLPSTSDNGISGTWSPATINTATAGTSTYTFTPDVGFVQRRQQWILL